MGEITSYTELLSPEPDDVTVIVDVHDLTMSPQGTTKQIAVANLTSGSGAISLTGGDLGGTVTVPTVVSTHLDLPLPVDQGGTGSGTQNFVDLSSAQSVSGAKTFTGTVAVPAPTASGQAATKGYVDGVASGLDVKDSVAASTTAPLPAYTYSNGASGVGATLTAATPAVLVVDGYTANLGDRILVQDETGANAPYNGIYSLTTAGTGSVPWVLTRTTDMDAGYQVPGAFCFVEAGTVNGLAGFVVVSTGTYLIGTTPILWTQFSSGGTSGGGGTSNGLPVFNVTAAAYGAVGNGVHVDTAGVMAAVAAAEAAGGGIVFFPPGVYPISYNPDNSPAGVAFGSSLIVQGSGLPGPGTAYPVTVTSGNSAMTVTAASALYPAGQAVVLGAGTIPTGLTDGQAYYLVSSSWAGGTWSFTISATYGGTAITPASAGTSVTVAAITGGTTLLLDPAQKSANGPNIEVCRVAPPSSNSYTSSFVMRDLLIDGGSAQWSPTDPSTQRVYGFYCGQGPGLVTPVQNVTMSNVTITRCRTYAFDIENAAQVLLVNCTAANNGFTAGSKANASNADGFTLIGNDVSCVSCKSYGNAVRGFAAGQDATTYARIELTDCEAWGNGESGCTFGSGTGFYLYGGRVNGGAYFSNGDAGIEVLTNGQSCAVTGAYAYGNTGAGIVLENGTGNTVSGCTTYGNGTAGIEASGQSYCAITGNSCTGDAVIGNDPEIYLTNSSTYCTVTGNTVNGTHASYAIAEQNSTTNYNVIVGNAVTSASTPVINTAGANTIEASNTGAASGYTELAPAIRTGSNPVHPGELSACDTTSGSFTLTLPPPPSAAGAQYGAKMIVQGTPGGVGNTVTIATSGTDVFNKTGGATSMSLSLLNQGILLQYLPGSPNGIWYILSDDLPLSQLDERYGATVSTVAAWGATPTVSAATAGVFIVTLSANVTGITVTAAPFAATVEQSVTLYIQQPASGTTNYTVTGWPGSVSWLSGAAPVAATGASAMTGITLQTFNGGTTWWGRLL